MLSIDEVKEISFRKANIGGYRVEDVNAFIDDVVETLEQNRRDKIDLVKKLDILAKRIEDYRKDEESVRGALINAEKFKETALKESHLTAETLVKDAQIKAQKIVYDANAAIVDQKNNYLKLQADAVVLRENLLETYKSHIRMLEDLPTVAEIGKTKTALDRRYPTDETFEEEVEEVDEVPDVPKREKPVDISSGTAEFKKIHIPTDVIESKFDNLEFGENYQPGKKSFKK
ncbi:hypothetical protein AGMMS50284_1580 [Clostridia bacterium]|nr:hypothetical protein AGMMS50284_1580 [Clostridia bacterium]